MCDKKTIELNRRTGKNLINIINERECKAIKPFNSAPKILHVIGGVR